MNELIKSNIFQCKVFEFIHLNGRGRQTDTLSSHPPTDFPAHNDWKLNSGLPPRRRTQLHERALLPLNQPSPGSTLAGSQSQEPGIKLR